MNFLTTHAGHWFGRSLTESGILGPNSTEDVLAGKQYSKAVRAHKLTVQALWQLLLPQLNSYLVLYKVRVPFQRVQTHIFEIVAIAAGASACGLQCHLFRVLAAFREFAEGLSDALVSLS